MGKQIKTCLCIHVKTSLLLNMLGHGYTHMRHWHYCDAIMGTIASQITSLTIVYTTVCSDADQSKHQSSASLAFVWGIHRDRWIPRTKGQLRGKCFHLMTSSWTGSSLIQVMDWCWFGAKRLPESMTVYCHLDPKQILMKVWKLNQNMKISF